MIKKPEATGHWRIFLIFLETHADSPGTFFIGNGFPLKSPQLKRSLLCHPSETPLDQIGKLQKELNST
jgi:hypothetical protein